jgi:hypothetical protein
MVYCGLCGHTLRCTRVKPEHPRYYACRGRTNRLKAKDTSPRCTLKYVRADWLEINVWDRITEVLSDKAKMVDCVRKALKDLEERKAGIGTEILDNESKVELVRKKMERLGMVFADGAINEEIYRSKLKQLKKQEATLIKCRKNIDPAALDEIDNLEKRISIVNEIIERGAIEFTDFGVFGTLGNENKYVPLGFNVLRENIDNLGIGEVKEMDYFGIEGTDKYIRGIDVPEGFWDYDRAEQEKIVIKSKRALLQLFNIKIIAYPDRVEIQGTIPPQVLYKEEKRESGTGRVSSSLSQTVSLVYT